MMRCLKLLAFGILLFPVSVFAAISIVYNFRIAQVTKQSMTENVENNDYTLVGLLFDLLQKKNSGVKQNFFGGLAAFIYDFNPYYFRTDFSASHIKEITDHVTTFSGTETDDLLFTVGRNFKLNHRSITTLSGLFGVPTHQIFTLQHISFGYGQVGLGVQLDGSYILCDTHTLLYGVRYIYFAPRNAVDDTCATYKFTIGNIADLLCAYKYDWSAHGVECGYTLRDFFGAHISPELDDIAKQTDYVRSSFYFIYKYKFAINEVTNRLLFNISYGFDHNPQPYNNKYILTFWGSWNVHF